MSACSFLFARMQAFIDMGQDAQHVGFVNETKRPRDNQSDLLQTKRSLSIDPNFSGFTWHVKSATIQQ